MNQNNVRNLPYVEFVEKLLEYNIGEHGRLIYLKNHLQEGKSIYDSDKRFLEICIQKLQELEGDIAASKNLEMNLDDKHMKMINKLIDAEIGDTNKLRLIKNYLMEGKPLLENDESYLEEKFEQFAKIDENERTTREALEIIKKLKQNEIGNSERLESIKEKLQRRITLSISDIRYFNQKAQELKKLQLEKSISSKKEIPKQELNQKIKQKPKIDTTTTSPFTVTIKISDVLLVGAIMVYAIWVLGLFLIDISPIQDHMLGLALGLGVGVVVLYKIQTKAGKYANQ